MRIVMLAALLFAGAPAYAQLDGPLPASPPPSAPLPGLPPGATGEPYSYNAKTVTTQQYPGAPAVTTTTKTITYTPAPVVAPVPQVNPENVSP